LTNIIGNYIIKWTLFIKGKTEQSG